MPGLLGAIHLHGGRIQPHLVAAMRDMLVRRDWYKAEDYISADGSVAMSRVHLGVNNMEPQPYRGHGGQVQVFLYGQVYDGQVNGLGPLESICCLYQEHGPDFASHLKGDYVIVIVDEPDHTVLIANDRIASKPLFYLQGVHALYFAPEIKCLLPIPELEKRICFPAVADFMANGHLTADHTLLEGIRWLDSATVLQIRLGNVAHHRYWEFRFEEAARDRGPHYYREMLCGLLRQAVHRCVQADHRYGILLSGGYDSRAILGCYLEERGQSGLETISWGQEEDTPSSDCTVARSLARNLGAHHGFYPLSAQEIMSHFETFVWLGEGLTDFPESYAVFDRIRERQGIQVVLRGDECFGYSRWTTVHDELSMFRSLDLRVLRYMADYRDILQPTYYSQFCDMGADTRRKLSAQCSARNIHNRKDFFYLAARVKHYLNPLNYVKNFALESYRPLLDYDILDFVATLPLKYRLGKWFWRATVVQLFPELYAQIAQRDNMIRWPAALRATPEVQRLVYRKLVEEKSVFTELICTDKLKERLDAFFALRVPVASSREKATAWLNASPKLYSFVHKGVYYAKKWTDKLDYTLDPERLILRLLILATWSDLFLNSPVVRENG